jgi:hypothetical protein
MPAPRGRPLLRRQHAPRLSQNHPGEAPPVSNTAAADVVLEVVALLGGEIDRACLGELVEPGMILCRQVVVNEVVESEAPYGTAHPAELPVDRIVVPQPADAGGERTREVNRRRTRR